MFLVLALVIGAVFRFPLVLDDPFITYRYANNLIAGNGFLFNAGERVLSTTTPLYTLVLACLGLVYRDLPGIGYWLCVLSYGIAAYLLYLMASVERMRLGGMVAGALLLLAPAVMITFGLETGFYLMLGLAALYAYMLQRTTLAFGVAALLTLTRNDGLILAGILSAHYLYVRREAFAQSRALRDRRLFLPFLVYLLILSPWIVFSLFYFGSPFPFTLAAKIAQAQSGLWDTFAAGFVGWMRDGVIWIAPLALAAGIGLAYAIRQRSLMLLLGAWAISHLIAYSLLGVAFYAWYVAPLIPALALFAGIGIEYGADWAVARAGDTRVVRLALGCAFAAILLVLELRADAGMGMLQPSPKAEAYAQAADWLARKTAADATVDALEVGIIGFYDARATYDFVGLVDPMRVPYLRAQKFMDGVKRRGAEYVLAIPPDVWLTQDAWFNNTYRAVHEIRVRGFYGNRPLVIFQRADAGRAPSETHTVNAAFEKRIELSNVELFGKEIRRAEILPLRLNLRTLDSDPIPETWKFTIQLVGAENRIVAQADSFYPARLPEDGKPFANYQGILIPPDAPTGEYELILAMYDAAKRERLSLYGANGEEVGDFVSLGNVEIRE